MEFVELVSVRNALRGFGEIDEVCDGWNSAERSELNSAAFCVLKKGYFWNTRIGETDGEDGVGESGGEEMRREEIGVVCE